MKTELLWNGNDNNVQANVSPALRNADKTRKDGIYARWVILRSVLLVVLALLVNQTPASATSYFVNDTNTSGDIFCTAVGDDVNAGTDPAAPKASLQAILDTYPLAGGDIIYVDTGLYRLINDVVITSADSGSSPSTVVMIQGSTNGTVFNGNGTNRLHLNGAQYVVVTNLVWTNSAAAIVINGGGSNRVAAVRFMNCDTGITLDGNGHIVDSCIFSNLSNTAISFTSGTNLEVLNCTVANTSYGYYGIAVWSGSDHLITNCTVRNAVQAVHLENCSNVRVSGCTSVGTSYYTYYGIAVWGGKDLYIGGCNVSNAVEAVHLENCSNVEVTDSELHHGSRGVVLSGGDSHYVHNCNIHHNSAEGVFGSGSFAPWLESIQVHDSVGSGGSRHGVSLSGCHFAQVIGNTITNMGNNGITISSCTSPSILSNTVCRATNNGVYVYGCNAPEVGDNTLYLNGAGLYCSGSNPLDMHGNRLYSNAGDGATVQSGGLAARNNLSYANGKNGLYVASVANAIIENNTFYHNVFGLTLWGDCTYARVANNIYDALGTNQTCFRVENLEGIWFSDYNNFHAATNAFVWDWMGTRYTLASWQKYSNRDRHSLDVDPLFVNPAGVDSLLGGTNGSDDDFHLQSTNGSYHFGTWTNDPASSLCIDAGDPANDYALELPPSGCRINLGFEGNTPEASKSPGPRLQVLFPNGGEINFRRIRVRWAAVGCWTTNDYVKIQYSTNNGSTWQGCLNANPLDHDNAIYGWDINAIPPGSNNLIRVTYLADNNFYDTSDAPFAILDPGPKTNYVNDVSTNGDEWCTATGSFTNTGLTINSPLDSFQAVVDRYPEIGASDEIRMDHGAFDPDRTLYLNDSSSGSASAKLTIRGTDTNYGPALFDRQDPTYDTVWLHGMNDVLLTNLNFADGLNGVNIDGYVDNPSAGMEVADCQFYGNINSGLLMSYCTNAIVNGNHAHDNGTGLSLDSASLVTSNVCYDNNGTGLSAGTVTGPIIGNLCYSNNGIGLSAGTVTGPITTNQCYNNSSGFYVTGASNGFTGNLSYSNGSAGITISYVLGDVTGNACHDNGSGFYVDGGPGSVSGNLCYSNGSGLSVSGTFSVQANQCHHNNGFGLSAAVSGPVEGNTVHENTGDGLDVSASYGSSVQAAGNFVYQNTGNGLSLSRDEYYWEDLSAEAVGNWVYLNGSTGLLLQGGATARYNVVYSNGCDGVYVSSCSDLTTITNNLIYGNGTNGSAYYNINVPVSRCGYNFSPPVLIENNTLDGGNGLYLDLGGTYPGTDIVRNNIIWAWGSGHYAFRVDHPPIGPSILNSDYNDLYTTNGASVGYWLGPRTKLSSWEAVTLRDSQSLWLDPLFVSATNFHLQSTVGSYTNQPFTFLGSSWFSAATNLSFCIDGGDPAAGWANELAPNGSRLNLGAFGNTSEASYSPTSRVVLLTYPIGGVKWLRTQTITWLTRGPWTNGDTVGLCYTNSWVTNWTQIATNIPYKLGRYDWNTCGLPSGTNFEVRVSWEEGPNVYSQSAPFQVLDCHSNYWFYMNDQSTNNDVYTSAPGSDGNDGLSPATPKADLQDVIDTYQLQGGDTVFIDTGNYPLLATIIITTNDVGSPGDPITFMGSTNGSVFNRNDSSNDGIYAQAASFLRFENLKVTGANNGIRVNGNGVFLVGGIEVLGCEVYSNSANGVLLSSCTNATISDNSAHNNGSYGISVNHASVVISNACYSNGVDGLTADTVAGPITTNLCYSNKGNGLTAGSVTGPIIGNLCYSNNGTGLSAYTVTGPITANTCCNNSSGFYIGTASGGFAGNLSYGNATMGIQIYQTLGGVTSNECHDNGGGFSVSGGPGSVSGNRCYNNVSGLSVSGAFSVQANDCHHNNGFGLSASVSGPVEGNPVHENIGDGLRVSASGSATVEAVGNFVYQNTGTGLTVSGSSVEAIRNQVYLNGATGLWLNDGPAAACNVVCSNGGDGVHVSSCGNLTTITNNLIYDNGIGGSGYCNISVPLTWCGDYPPYPVSPPVVVENNTLDGGNGLYLDLGAAYDWTNSTVRNNIIWARGAGAYAFRVDNPPVGPFILTSDYNDLYATDGAGVAYWLGPRNWLHAWQAVTLRDPHSLSFDPLFVSATNSNFHLQSTLGSYKGPPFTAPGGGSFTADATNSFCIDAGDTNSAYNNEPAPNGCRINLGAFGNTPDASLSPTRVVLTSPKGGEKWFRTQTITWLAQGICTGTVTLSYSPSGTNGPWIGITNGLSPAAGRFDWNTCGLLPGTNYWVQVCVGSLCDVSKAPFTILDCGPRSFYLNDSSTNGDVYTSAPGSHWNDGLTANRPKANLQDLLDTYMLAGGDVVYIDTGNYPLPATVIVTINDAGSPANPIIFRGCSNGSVFNRYDSGNDGIYVQGAGYLSFVNLKVTGANDGIHVSDIGAGLVPGIEVLDCELYSNGTAGILLSYCTNAIIQGNSAHHNGALSSPGAGLAVNHASVVSSNVCYSNVGYGLWADTVAGPVTANLCYANIGQWCDPVAGLTAGTVSGPITANRCYSNGDMGFYIGAALTNFTDNLAYDNTGSGIWIYQALDAVFNNECYSNGISCYCCYGCWCVTSFEVDSGSGSVSSNQCFGNSGELAVNGTFCVQANACHNNRSGLFGFGLWTSDCNPVEGNLVCQNTGGGLWVASYNNPSVEVVDNTVYQNTGDGLQVWSYYGSPVEALGNVVYQNTGNGLIVSGASGEVVGNLVYQNTGDGLSVSGASAVVTNNRVYLNGYKGLLLYGGASAQRNVVYSNGRDGVYVSSSGDLTTIQNNLIYGNGTSGSAYYNINVPLSSSWSPPVLIENNTLYGGNGLHLDLGGTSTRTDIILNNIIWARGGGYYAFRVDHPPIGPFILTSDYNDLYATDGASIGWWLGNQAEFADWQYFTRCDSHSLSFDPLFVSATNSNFHLQSTVGSYKGPPFTAPGDGSFTADATNSFCIDAGDTNSAYNNEPTPNGCRINLGAFGNTPDASLSPTVVLLTSPNGGEKWFRTQTITWLAHGVCTGTVTLSYSSTTTNGPWTQIVTGLSPAAGRYNWDTCTTIPGTNYWVRVCVDGTYDVSDAPFEILTCDQHDFYVNDDSTTNDVYCHTIGNNANDGLTPWTPKLTLKRLVRDYTLLPGDTVWIDTGVYRLDSTLRLFDSGAAGAPIYYVGSTNPDGSVFYRNDTSMDLFLVAYTHDVCFENVRLTGALNGINAFGASSNHINAIMAINCQFYGNGNDGILLQYCDSPLISQCQMFANSKGAILLQYCGSPSIVGCEAYQNAGVSGGQLSLLNCSNAVVGGSLTHDSTSGAGGIRVDSPGMTVTNNECRNDGGMNLSGDGLAGGNHVHYGSGGLSVTARTNFVVQNNESDHNTPNGIYVAASPGPALVQNNLAHENSGNGVRMDGNPAQVIGNRIYLNSSTGLWLNNGVTARRNAVYSNGGDGVYVSPCYNLLTTIQNNLIYDNGSNRIEYYNVNIPTTYNCNNSPVLFENNTLYGGNGLFIAYSSSYGYLVTNRNNIIWAEGSGRAAVTVVNPQVIFASDYNDLFVTNDAIVGYWGGIGCPTLANWQSTSARDASSLSVNPLFVDPDGSDDLLGGYYGNDDDFHLQSKAGSYHNLGYWTNDLVNSPCIDAGDPSTMFTNEPAYNGLRVNLGAYGNTEQASKTDYGGLFHTLTVTNVPSNGGSISVWPAAALYPTNRLVTVSASAARGFYFQMWANGISTTTNPISFYVTNDMVIEAWYGVLPLPDLAPVGVASLSNSVVFYPPSPQSPTVPVTWAVTNQGTASASNSWNDRVYVSTNTTLSGAVSSQTFYEHWSSPPLAVGGLYQRTNTITLPQRSGTYYLILSVDDGDRLYEGNESNNVMVSTPVTLTYVVHPPDLAPVSVNTLGEAVSGVSVQVACVVTNQGTGSASGNWSDGIYISTSPVFDTNATFLTEVEVYNTNVPPGGSYAWTNAAPLPQMPVGMYYLFVVVDDQSQVYESTKTNNTSAAVPITLTLPDLAPVSVSVPAGGVSGMSVQVACVVTNQGSGSALGLWKWWVDGIYFSSSPVFDTNATLLTEVDVYNTTVAPGGSYAWTNSASLPQVPAGTYYLFVVVDDPTYYGYQVYESTKTNNTSAALSLAGVTPDLAPVSMSALVVAGVSGMSVQMACVVTNQGMGSASGWWYDGIYFSSNSVFGTNATRLTGVGSNHNVAAGGSYMWTNSVSLAQVPAGTYYLFVVVDDQSQVYESTKTNNTSAALSLAGVTPDLAPVSVSASVVAGVSGMSVQMACVVTNQGMGSASGYWYDGIYFSSNSVFGTNATRLTGVWSNHNVAAGGSYAWTNSATFPQVPAGTYYLFVVVDDQSQVYESTKTNNTSAALPLAGVTPDLAPVSVVAPAGGVAGQSMSVACVVTNQGMGSASGWWYDGIYFSSNSVFGTNATRLTGVWGNHNVAAGGSYAWTNSATLPQVPVGTYYLFVVVDDQSLVYESTKTNNTSTAVSFTVGWPPALTQDTGTSEFGPITNVFAFIGGNVNFYANFVGTMPITNQWLFSSTGSGYAPIAGATNDLWILTNVQSLSVGFYRLGATNAYGSSNSTPSHLTALAAPGAPPSNGVTNMYAYCVYTNHPWAYWKFEETNDTLTSSMQAYDYSGHNFDATYGNSNGNPNSGCLDGGENISLNAQNGPNPNDYLNGYSGLPANNGCAALSYGYNNGYLKVPPLNLNTNTVTFTIWIYPIESTPIISASSGLLMNRNGSDAAGVGFSGNQNANLTASLGYTWNSNNAASYGWDSHLYPLSQIWSFVAYVISPQNTTIYLYYVSGGQTNLYKAVSSITNAPEAFSGGTTWIGGDNWDNGRTFNGNIDEVAVFTNAMSEAQIQDLFLKSIGAFGVAPVFTMQPTNTTIFMGQTLQLSAVAGGIPNPGYQWQVFNGSAWANLGAIPGTTPTNSTFYWTNFTGQFTYFRVLATNLYGTMPSAQAQVTVIGPPIITCPSNITMTVCSTGAVVNYTVKVSGGCPPYTTNCVPPSGSVFPIGTTTVSCSATDSCGQSASNSFTVTVSPPPPLSITCPSNITRTGCSTGEVVNYTVAFSGGLPPYTTNCVPPSGSVFPMGTTTVNCCATDSSGQTNCCSFTVTVSLPPLSITCPSNMTVTGCSTGAVVIYTVRVSGGCPPYTTNCVPPSGSVFPMGTTNVNCCATDSCGQSNCCSFTVTVCAPPALTQDTGTSEFGPITNIFAFIGGNMNFYAAFDGSPVITNQWLVKLDSGGGYTNIAGATNDLWILTNVQSSSAGFYELAVTNAVGHSNSTPAHLTALAVPGAPTNIGTNAYSYCVYTNHPWAYWKFEETQNTLTNSMQAYDYSGHNFDATYGNYDGTSGSGCLDGGENIINSQYGPNPNDYLNGYPGLPSTNGCAGLSYTHNNGVLYAPPLNLNTNTLTFTMWIYPNDASPLITANAGLLMNRNGNDAAGVGFSANRNANLTASLGYTWNNNSPATYNWDSRLYPLPLQWQFVAYVISPQNTTIYQYYVSGGATNLLKAVSNLTNAPEAFSGGTTWIGGDNWDNGRTFNGYIDEVAVFTNAMSENQIQGLFLRALGLTSGVAPTITTQPTATALFMGQTLQLSVVAGGIPNPGYQWQVWNGSAWASLGAIPGASVTNSTLYWTNFVGLYSSFRVLATNLYGTTPSSSAAVTTYPVANWNQGLWTVNFGIATTSHGGPGTPYFGRGVLGTNMYWNALTGNHLNNITSLRDDGTHSGINFGSTNAYINTFSSAQDYPMNNVLLDQFAQLYDTNGVNFYFTRVPPGKYNLALYSCAGAYVDRGAVFTVFTNGVSAGTKSVINVQDTFFLPNDNTVVYTNLLVTNGTLRVKIGIVPATPSHDPNTEADFNGAQLELVTAGPDIWSITINGTNFTLIWVGGKLQQATNILGPWVMNPATSPYTNPATGEMRFFRIYTNK